MRLPWIVATELSWLSCCMAVASSPMESNRRGFRVRLALILSLRNRSSVPSLPCLTVRLSSGRYSLGIWKGAEGLAWGRGFLFFNKFCFSKSVMKRAFMSSNSSYQRLCCRLKIFDHSSSFSSDSDFCFAKFLLLPLAPFNPASLYGVAIVLSPVSVTIVGWDGTDRSLLGFLLKLYNGEKQDQRVHICGHLRIEMVWLLSAEAVRASDEVVAFEAGSM